MSPNFGKKSRFFFVVYHCNRHLFPCVSVKSRHCSHIMGARFDNEIHDITFKLHDIFIKNSQQFKLHANHEYPNKTNILLIIVQSYLLLNLIFLCSCHY